MCGIAGIFAYHQDAAPVRDEELLTMREAMVARGPDGAGLWIAPDKKIGLAHRRLSIIDLSDAGTQPMSTGDGRLQVVFNGEIYNYRALRSELESRGCHFQTQSDTEVLLHLYAEKGREMVHDLRGMYAFALWDEERHGLFMARDPFGIKPLYYADDGKTFRFASQVKSLLAGNGTQSTLEPAGHVGFFLWGFVPDPYTLFKEIRALPAGSILWIDRTGRCTTQIFCQISEVLARAQPLQAKRTREEIQEGLRTILVDSVQHHLIADVPVGVFLSSGLDSTTIAALASELVPGNLQTVTLGFQEYKATEKDETPLAELVARHYETKHQTRWVAKTEFQTEFDRLLFAMDQPSVDGVNTYFVSKVVVASGLKTALSGLGGDELFGGYPGFSQIPRLVNLLAPLRYIPGLGKGFRLISAPFLKQMTSPKYAGLLEYGSNYSGAYLLRRGLFMPWELPDILDGQLLRDGWRELQMLMHLENTVQGIQSDTLKISALELTWYMRHQLLRDSDWAGMAHSLEIRVPLVDIELLKSLTLLLTENSLPHKFAMAQTPRKSLPDEILSRPKTGFNIPVQQWLQQESDLRDRDRGLRGWAKTVYENCYR